jgi:hypothetical protein
MTFTEGVLRLARIGARIERPAGRSQLAPVGAAEAAEAVAAGPVVEAVTAEPAEAPAEPSPFEPGFADLEAAVALVEAGLATRVVLSGFRPWPGLLWQARELVEEAGVQILPTAAHPGGRVDIVVMRDATADG